MKSRSYRSKSHRRSRHLSLLAVVSLSASISGHLSAQASGNQSPSTIQQSKPGSSNSLSVAPPLRQTQNGPAKKVEAPQPAIVTLKDGTLTVQANDSDLRQILGDLSRDSGMLIDGQVKETRVFGTYGPRKPEEVLTELLTGLGYNVIMSGSSVQGVPLELKLSNRIAGPTPPAPAPVQQAEEPRLGPGAVAHPPPAEEDNSDLRRQTNLRRLQQMQEARQKTDDDGRR